MAGKLLLIAIFAFFTLGAPARALDYPCSLVTVGSHQFMDVNCDGTVRIGIAGDSIGYGTGDSYKATINGKQKLYKNKGGFGIRILEHFDTLTSQIAVTNIAHPGDTSWQMYKRVEYFLSKKSSAFRHSDVVYLNIGANDYWLKISSTTTKENILKTVQLLKKYGIKAYLIGLTPNTRDYQIPWFEAVTEATEKIVAVDLSDMPESTLTSDGLHPGPKGYTYMGTAVRHHLEQNWGNPEKHLSLLTKTGLVTDTDGDGLANKAEKAEGTNPKNPDSDVDQINDHDELLLYHTKPKKKDTDHDSLFDGDEISVYFTDPNDVDTDDDGFPDGIEVLVKNTDPTDPNSF